MKLTKEMLHTFTQKKGIEKLCNESIFEEFFNTLLLLNFDNIDGSMSTIEIVDMNGNIIEANDFSTFQTFSKRGCSYFINIVSKNNTKIKLGFDLQGSQVNIYIGNFELHYADDAQVQSQEEIEVFKNQLKLLFYSKIIEELTFKNESLKKYVYKFNLFNSDVFTFKHSIGFSLFFGTKSIQKVIYSPWLEK
jgi:hypothetical protein